MLLISLLACGNSKKQAMWQVVQNFPWKRPEEKLSEANNKEKIESDLTRSVNSDVLAQGQIRAFTVAD